VFDLGLALGAAFAAFAADLGLTENQALNGILSAMTAATFGAAVLAERLTPDAHRVARAASWVVLFSGLNLIARAVADPPWSMVLHPAQDVWLLSLALGWWHVRRERWTLVLAGLLFAALAIHAGFWFGDLARLRSYIVLNNVLFAFECATVFVAGGLYVVGGARARHRGRVPAHRRGVAGPLPVRARGR